MAIHTIRGRRANSYLVEEEARLMVIDVAFLADGMVLDYIRRDLGRSPHDVEAVLCTHGHGDHLGGVAALAAACDAEVYLPPLTVHRRRLRFASPWWWLGQWRAWFRGSGSDNDETVVRHLSHGEPVPGFASWQVVHTPGHTEDSCCYFHPDTRSLITGDTILGSGRTGRLVLPAIYRNREQLMASIRAVAELQPRAIYPGHGSSLEGDALLADLVAETSGAY